jgi:hypothetical protein
MIAVVRNIHDNRMVSHFKFTDYREASIPWLVDNVGPVKVKEITAHRGIPAAIQVPSWSLMADLYLKLQHTDPELDWYRHDLTIGTGWQIFISAMSIQLHRETPIQCTRITIAVDDPLLAMQFKLACI